MQRQHHVLIKDNPELEPLMQWLKMNSVEGVQDFPDESRNEVLRLLRGFEVKFDVVQDPVFPELVFSNVVPLQGDFRSAIKEILNLLYDMMYKP